MLESEWERERERESEWVVWMSWLIKKVFFTYTDDFLQTFMKRDGMQCHWFIMFYENQRNRVSMKLFVHWKILRKVNILIITSTSESSKGFHPFLANLDASKQLFKRVCLSVFVRLSVRPFVRPYCVFFQMRKYECFWLLSLSPPPSSPPSLPLYHLLSLPFAIQNPW